MTIRTYFYKYFLHPNEIHGGSILHYTQPVLPFPHLIFASP
jgi:hypothetical protein